MSEATKRNPLYGLVAEFDRAEDVVRAARAARETGYRQMDAYAPFPVEGLAEAVGFPKTRLPLITLIGGLIGCFGGFFLQVYPNVFGYPLDIGGKPYYSWPAFIPITFELTILCATIFCVFGMLFVDGFPTPYHPIFNAPDFERATRDKFFLCIKSRDHKFDPSVTREFLASQKPQQVSEVRV
jgi:Alternative complex III, ActD subunit